jgi:hypothetical protein
VIFRRCDLPKKLVYCLNQGQLQRKHVRSSAAVIFEPTIDRRRRDLPPLRSAEKTSSTEASIAAAVLC